MGIKFDYCDHGTLHVVHLEEIWNVQEVSDKGVVLNLCGGWPAREYRHHYHGRTSKFRFINDQGRMRVRTSQKAAFLYSLKKVLKGVKARAFMFVDPTCRCKVDEGGLDRMTMEFPLEHLIKGGVDDKTLLAAAPATIPEPGI